MGVFQQGLLSLFAYWLLDPQLDKEVFISGGTWGGITAAAALLTVITSSKSKVLIQKLFAWCCRCFPEYFSNGARNIYNGVSDLFKVFALGESTTAWVQSMAYRDTQLTAHMRGWRVGVGLGMGLGSFIKTSGMFQYPAKKIGKKLPQQIEGKFISYFEPPAPSKLTIERYEKFSWDILKLWGTALLLLGFASETYDCTKSESCSSSWPLLLLPVYYVTLALVAAGIQLMLDCCRSQQHLYQQISNEEEQAAPDGASPDLGKAYDPENQPYGALMQHAFTESKPEYTLKEQEEENVPAQVTPQSG